jgi:hypothetical protein
MFKEYLLGKHMRKRLRPNLSRYKFVFAGPNSRSVLVFIAWTLRPWVRIPRKAWVFVLAFLCCVALCKYTPLGGADHSPKGVLLSVYID